MYVICMMSNAHFYVLYMFDKLHVSFVMNIVIESNCKQSRNKETLKQSVVFLLMQYLSQYFYRA